MLNLAMLLETSARAYPGREAVVAGDLRLTYEQVNTAANRVAHMLAERGVGRGDKVAVSCPNLLYFPVVYYGTLKAGATVVPLNILLTEREIAYHLEDSGAKAYFCFAGTDALPMGKAGRAAFDQVPGCSHFFLMSGTFPDPGLPADFDTVQTSEADTDRKSVV